MKKCKSCQSEIDSKAKKCPKCQEDQRGWFRRHPFLTGLLVLFVLGMIGAASGGSDNASTVGTDSAQNDESTEIVQVESAEPLMIRVEELADDFDSNQVAAESKWENKLVQFSAEISNITDSGIAFYNVSSEEFSATQISCRIKDKQQLLALKNGETISVKGIVRDQTIGVITLAECEVVQD